MAQIRVLDKDTIDQIAAGEVVERPMSVVKELVENSIDAGAGFITVEIKGGGIDMIRVTDNGCGIESAYIRQAFLRHATSKITGVEDLNHIRSLGFRGEALSSICAVSRTEVMTKTPDSLTGIRYINEGSEEVSAEEVGCPDGTTIIVRNLFFNVPVRRKFLRSSTAEGNAVGDLMEHLALSNPNISFQFINNGKSVFSTSGNNDLKEVIYRIYGKQTASEILPFDFSNEKFRLTGYIGKPEQNRSNRNFEIFFINHRYVKNDVLMRCVEEGYKQWLMQHMYPFCVMNLEIDPSEIDVNVHPTKMEVRFVNPNDLFFTISDAIYHTLHSEELIPKESPDDQPQNKRPEPVVLPQAFEQNRIQSGADRIHEEYESARKVMSEHIIESIQERESIPPLQPVIKARDQIIVEDPIQMNMFDEERLLSDEVRPNIQILGQIFKTYWLLTYDDKLFIVDQHAAHEKVNYERFMRQYRESKVALANIMPAIVLTLNTREKEALQQYKEQFMLMGFQWEDYGGNEIRLNAVPYELFGYDARQMFLSTLDQLSEGPLRGDNDFICGRIATMACKASVKGNDQLSVGEMEALLDQLMQLEDPYHCPHGRPTIISMSKYEIEKKFKRIV